MTFVSEAATSAWLSDSLVEPELVFDLEAEAAELPEAVWDATKRHRQSFFPFSNDRDLGPAYHHAAAMRANNDSLASPVVDGAESQAATLVVGHGAFETAVQVIDPADTILFCDFHPLTLFVQSGIIRCITGSDSISEYRARATAFFESVDAQLEARLLKTPFFKNRQQRYWYDQPDRWVMHDTDRDFVPPHFLEDDQAFQRTKEAMAHRSFRFCHIDFNQPEAVAELSHCLKTGGYIVRQANATNVFEHDRDNKYAAGTWPTLRAALPWAEGAPILQSNSRARLMSCVDRLEDFKPLP